MSILTVEHLSHGFGDRAIFEDVSFRLLKGEHIGLIGANGEGKSTFMNIITGKLMPDEGKIEWAKNVRVGYLDQHTVLEKGMTLRQVLASAFDYLFEWEAQMNAICDKMGDASEDEMMQYMEDLGTIQDLLDAHDFYMIDSKVLLGKLLLEKPDILLLDEPTNHLDVDAKAELKRALQEYKGSILMVCHEPDFYEGLATDVWDATKWTTKVW